MGTKRSSANPEGGHFSILVEMLVWRGKGLVHPECVLATCPGDIFTANWRDGVAHVEPMDRRIFIGEP